jgi:hypothetical protein
LILLSLKLLAMASMAIPVWKIGHETLESMLSELQLPFA